jgi:hypothetical protein
LDYLLIGLVDSFRRSATVAQARLRRINQEIQQATLKTEPDIKIITGESSEQDIEQHILARLEEAGNHVGSCLTER